MRAKVTMVFDPLPIQLNGHRYVVPVEYRFVLIDLGAGPTQFNQLEHAEGCSLGRGGQIGVGFEEPS